MTVFDAHFHIYGNAGEIPSAGLCCSAVEADWPAVIALSRNSGGIIPCLGIHPWHVKGKKTEILERLRQAAAETGSFIGETGLDGLRPDMESQEYFFAAQLRMAAGLGVPAVIHCVRAWGRLLRIIRECRPGRFLVHSYNGSTETMEELLDMGGWFSFGPRLAIPNEKKTRKAFLYLPEDRFLLESEGGISQKQGLYSAAAAAAEIKGISLSEISAAANANYRNFTLGYSPL